MNFLQNCKKLVLSLDLFCSSQLLRYKQDTQYKTLTGGLLSLGIIIVITLGFAGMITDTFNKTSITSDLTKIKQTDPTSLTLQANPQKNFMFGIQISSADSYYRYNLSSTRKIFSVYLIHLEFQYSKLLSRTLVPMEQCTQRHWSMMDVASASNFGVDNTLCLPVGYNMTLRGSFSSPQYTIYQIKVLKCQNSTYDNSCASQAEIDALIAGYGNFVIGMTYLNPVINPTQPDAISYYFELNDFLIFSNTVGSQGWLQFSDFTINTDISLLPFTDTISYQGAIALTKTVLYPMAAINNVLAMVNIVKSSNSLVYNRQVQKISAVFSYIGGLVGAVTAFLFMLKAYTDSSLEITIGIGLFEQQKKGGQLPIFNLFGYLKLNAYRLLKFCKWKGEWKQPQKIQQYQAEAIKQLDISILLNRIFLLQTCINFLIPKEQIGKIMKASEGFTVKSAKQMRSLHKIEQEKKKKNIDTIQVEEYMDEDMDKHNQSALREKQNNCISNVREQSWFNILQTQKKQQHEQEGFQKNKPNQKNNGREIPLTEVIKKNHELYLLAPVKQETFFSKQKAAKIEKKQALDIQLNQTAPNPFEYQ